MPPNDPRRMPPEDSALASPSMPRTAIDFPMTCDRPCMTERGLMVHPGTRVMWDMRIAAHAVRVRMEDGSYEVVRPSCFRQSRALAEFKERALRALRDANLHHGATDEVPGLRAAIEMLPDRAGLARLPGDVRTFLETNLALVRGG